MPTRFVVLLHEDSRGMHWDLMLENGPVLKTWALECQPDSAGTIRATLLADHRLAYLEYEGEISDARGTVTRWDQGVVHIEQQTATQWIFAVEGKKLQGRATLTCQPNQAQKWEFYFTSNL